jgi:basic amino acid/polyamine antiporter, APA family
MSAPASSAKLGPWTATALVVGNIIGVGVFMLPAALAPFGAGSFMGWALTATGALCLAWVFASLARALPRAGGAMAIVREAFGGDIAFLNAWGYWTGMWVANAIIVIGAVNYLGTLVPAIGASRPLAGLTGVTLLWLFAGINLRGLRTAGRVQLVTTVLKLWPFIATFAVVALLLASGGPSVIVPIDRSQFTLSAAATTATLTLYTVAGLECAALPADAIEDPERVVPLATIGGTLFAVTVNMALCVSLVLLMPAATVAASSAPLTDFVSRGLGPLASALVSVAVVISALGCLNGWLLLTGEVPAAMAAAGELPSWWGRRNSRGASVNAALTGHVLATGLIIFNATSGMSGVFTFIVQLSTATTLPLYLFAPLAALRFMADGRMAQNMALGLSAIGGLLFGTVAIVGSGAAAIAWGLGFILAGWPLYRVMGRRARIAAPRST